MTARSTTTRRSAKRRNMLSSRRGFYRSLMKTLHLGRVHDDACAGTHRQRLGIRLALWAGRAELRFSQIDENKAVGGRRGEDPSRSGRRDPRTAVELDQQHLGLGQNIVTIQEASADALNKMLTRAAKKNARVERWRFAPPGSTFSTFLEMGRVFRGPSCHNQQQEMAAMSHIVNRPNWQKSDPPLFLLPVYAAGTRSLMCRAPTVYHVRGRKAKGARM